MDVALKIVPFCKLILLITCSRRWLESSCIGSLLDLQRHLFYIFIVLVAVVFVITGHRPAPCAAFWNYGAELCPAEAQAGNAQTGGQGTIVYNKLSFGTIATRIRVAQRKRGGPITHRSQDRNLALIIFQKFTFFPFFSLSSFLLQDSCTPFGRKRRAQNQTLPQNPRSQSPPPEYDRARPRPPISE